MGLTDDPDPIRWKKQHPEVRTRMKSLQLAINYGMGVPSLARGLDRHPLIASAIIELHRHEFPPFWRWRENMVEKAMLERKSKAYSGGRCVSAPARTSVRSTISPCSPTALKCCGWRRGAC